MRKRANRNLHLGITTAKDYAFFLMSSSGGNDYPLGKLKGTTDRRTTERTVPGPFFINLINFGFLFSGIWIDGSNCSRFFNYLAMPPTTIHYNQQCLMPPTYSRSSIIQ